MVPTNRLRPVNMPAYQHIYIGGQLHEVRRPGDERGRLWFHALDGAVAIVENDYDGTLYTVTIYGISFVDTPDGAVRAEHLDGQDSLQFGEPRYV